METIGISFRSERGARTHDPEIKQLDKRETRKMETAVNIKYMKWQANKIDWESYTKKDEENIQILHFISFIYRVLEDGPTFLRDIMWSFIVLTYSWPLKVNFLAFQSIFMYFCCLIKP